jgi:hypothetical protein
MIITKAQKYSKEAGVVHCPASVYTESASSGIRASQDDIRMCAYYIYQKRGSAQGSGSDTQDWAEAERLISQR